VTQTASTPEDELAHTARARDDLVRAAQVRAAFASGEAQRELEGFPVNEEEISIALGAAHNLVGRWARRERRPSGPFAVRYSHLVESLRRAVK
jgi:hypothetical protein